MTVGSTAGRALPPGQASDPGRHGVRRYAEQRGFEAVWQAESRLVREATVPMAAFAAVTERIRIGSGVVNNWTRNVGLLAATFSTLDDLAPGRIMLGIGAWWEPLAAKVGVHRRSSAARRCARPSRPRGGCSRWSGSPTTASSSTSTTSRSTSSTATARRSRCPIYIGATGLKMMELAGEIGDGVVLNYMVGPEYNAEAMEALAAGAGAGRPPRRRHRPAPARRLLRSTADRDVALDRARELLTQYLGQQPHIMKASGVDPALIEEIGRS